LKFDLWSKNSSFIWFLLWFRCLEKMETYHEETRTKMLAGPLVTSFLCLFVFFVLILIDLIVCLKWSFEMAPSMGMFTFVWFGISNPLGSSIPHWVSLWFNDLYGLLHCVSFVTRYQNFLIFSNHSYKLLIGCCCCCCCCWFFGS
jgi:hypothetical protein